MRPSTIFAATFAATPLVLASAQASAQEVHLYDEGRQGATFGLALGGGNLGCSGEGCDQVTEAGSLDFHVGGMFGPRIAGLFDAWWMVHDEDRMTVNQVIMTGGVRVWPLEQFWLQGGLGLARAGYEYRGIFADIDDRSEWVPAFSVGIGVEPIATDTFALDIGLRYGTGFYSDGDSRIHNGSLTVGISVY